MVEVTKLCAKEEFEKLRSSLVKAFQSSHINFLIGSGASDPAIPLAGCIEQRINDAVAANQSEAEKLKYDFLIDIQNATLATLYGENQDKSKDVIKNYVVFLATLEYILAKRNNHVLPRRANIFTTNYDLFIEKASEDRGYLLVNDGFQRASGLSTKLRYDTGNFFTSTFHTGNLYDYRAEIPSVSLLKLHGSLSWRYTEERIEFNEDLRRLVKTDRQEDQNDFLKTSGLIFPERRKFQDTVLVEVYYDLLRIYLNALERENSLLIVFGFSFADKHIYDITCRALKNPTLKAYVFAYSTTEGNRFAKCFNGFNNVEIIMPSGLDSRIEFSCFNKCLQGLPIEEDRK